MEANLVASFKRTTFPIIQATHAHCLSNNQVNKWYYRLELSGRCMLLSFLSSPSHISFKLFQGTHVHGSSNNQVIKWYLRLELRGTCPLLRFLSSSSLLHLAYPISMANQREFELLQVQSQTLRA